MKGEITYFASTYLQKSRHFLIFNMFFIILRDIHSKEKEFLINEIKRLTKRNEHETNAQQNEDVSDFLGSLSFSVLTKNGNFDFNCQLKSKFLFFTIDSPFPINIKYYTYTKIYLVVSAC